MTVSTETTLLPFADSASRIKHAHVVRGFIPNPPEWLAEQTAIAIANGAAWEDRSTSVQTVKSLFMNPDNNRGLFQLFQDVMLEANERFWGMRLDRWNSCIFQRYPDGGLGMGRHNDYTQKPHDKLTFSLPLVQPAVGGGLVLHDFNGGRPVALAAGDLVIFGGYEPHSVQATPAGERVSLIGALGGPTFI